MSNGGAEEEGGLVEAVRAVMSAEVSWEESEARLRALAAEHPGEGLPWEALARAAEAAEAFETAAEAYGVLLELGGDDAMLWHRRGVARFFAGEIEGALADFDAYLAREPSRRAHHWQRGIALYYAGRYADGVAQFALHHSVNPDDVENAVWQFLCAARAQDLEAARANLLPFTRDARVPMAEIHALFAGTGSRDAVLAAANAGARSETERRNQLCYAHLYLGLFEETRGHPNAAIENLTAAATTYAMPHYMGRVAQVHLKLRSQTDRADKP